MENTKTVVLEFPVQLPDRMLTEVRLRRVTLGDMIECPLPQQVGETVNLLPMARLLGRLTGLSLEDVRQIDAADFTKLVDEVNRFLGAGVA